MDIENVVYIYTMEYYSAIKKDVMTFASKWVDLKTIKVSKISQSRKPKGIFLLICER